MVEGMRQQVDFFSGKPAPQCSELFQGLETFLIDWRYLIHGSDAPGRDVRVGLPHADSMEKGEVLVRRLDKQASSSA